MRCLSCRRWSREVICPCCRETLLVPTVSTRRVGSMDVVSLFRYQNIDQLLLSKHKALGYRLYRFFGRRYLQPFLQAFAEGLEAPVYLLPVDDLPQGGYSHTAAMVHAAAVEKIRPLYGVLRAQNRVRYAGQSLRFRLENPRDFHYTGPRGIDVILLDDIITTGSTLSEAKQVLAASGVNVLFALTIADAREG